MRTVPAQPVLDRIAKHGASDLFISAVSEAELRTSVAILPEGRCRDRLQLAINFMIDHYFRERVLPFDIPSAKVYAEIAAQRRTAGRPFAEADCQIRHRPLRKCPGRHPQCQVFRRLRHSPDRPLERPVNAVEIEQTIFELAENPFDRQEFPFQFHEAFGNKNTTQKRLC